MTEEFFGIIESEENLIYEIGSVQADREKFAMDTKQNLNVLGTQASNQFYLDWL